MTAEDIASGRYDVTPPDTYGAGPAGPHTHGDAAPPPEAPAAGDPANPPAEQAPAVPPPAAAAPAPAVERPAASGDVAKAEGTTPRAGRQKPAAERETAGKDTAPAAAGPRRSEPSPQRVAAPATQPAPAPIAQAPVGAAAPPAPVVRPAAQPASRPEGKRTRQEAAVRKAARSPRGTSAASRAATTRREPVPLPPQVALRRTGPAGDPTASHPVAAPGASVPGRADAGGQAPAIAGIAIAVSIAGGALLLWRRLRPAAVSGPERRTPLDDAIEAELQDLLTAERLQGEERTDVHAGAAAAAGRADGR